jgi:hypothetical protein
MQNLHKEISVVFAALQATLYILFSIAFCQYPSVANLIMDGELM